MTNRTSTVSHPRMVKLVRDEVAQFMGSSEVGYAPVPADELIPALRKKLAEEVAEYLIDPSIGELADVYEVVCALAKHDLGISLADLCDEAESKADERGRFEDGMAMYVRPTAPARHEGEHA